MNKSEVICCQTRDTICGPLLMASSGDELVVCRWADDAHTPGVLARVAAMLSTGVTDCPAPAVERAFALVSDYLADGTPLPPVCHRAVGTPFQRTVWDALETIPHGTVVSYSDVARAIGRPRAVRAVAAAISANPLELIIPCHRVVSVSRALTGYAGGLDIKRFLLDIEHSPVK